MLGAISCCVTIAINPAYHSKIMNLYSAIGSDKGYSHNLIFSCQKAFIYSLNSKC